MGRDGSLIYSARIELSKRVVDDAAKLRATLCHELCHAAAWLLDKSNKPPHGAAFRAWAARAMAACPGLDVTTCHSYDIVFAYRYLCTNGECGTEYGRHSASIDTSRKACGLCGGRLSLAPRLKADGTPAAKRAPTAFSLFVKDHFGTTKASMGPKAPHAEVMRELSLRWKAQQRDSSSGASGGSGGASGSGDDDLDGALRALDLSGGDIEDEEEE